MFWWGWTYLVVALRSYFLHILMDKHYIIFGEFFKCYKHVFMCKLRAKNYSWMFRQGWFILQKNYVKKTKIWYSFEGYCTIFCHHNRDQSFLSFWNIFNESKELLKVSMKIFSIAYLQSYYRIVFLFSEFVALFIWEVNRNLEKVSMAT